MGRRRRAEEIREAVPPTGHPGSGARYPLAPDCPSSQPRRSFGHRKAEPTMQILSAAASAHEDASRPMATTDSQNSQRVYVASGYVKPPQTTLVPGP